MNATQTIHPHEAAHFGTLAADWWDPRGSSAMLHRLNPVRLRYLRERLSAEWGIDPHAPRPLAGRRVLDVCCGAGLLAEPLSRLGGAVIGIDAAPENVAVAKELSGAIDATVELVERLGEARTREGLSSRARVVSWCHGHAPAAASSPAAVAMDEAALAPLIEAGFEIVSVLSPAQALARVVRARQVGAPAGTAVAALSLRD